MFAGEISEFVFRLVLTRTVHDDPGEPALARSHIGIVLIRLGLDEVSFFPKREEYDLVAAIGELAELNLRGERNSVLLSFTAGIINGEETIFDVAEKSSARLRKHTGVVITGE